MFTGIQTARNGGKNEQLWNAQKEQKQQRQQKCQTSVLTTLSSTCNDGPANETAGGTRSAIKTQTCMTTCNTPEKLHAYYYYYSRNGQCSFNV